MSYWDRKERSRKKKRRVQAAGGGHVMSKPEAAVMRRIRSETGMTEEQVRGIKKYRKMLSDAQPAALEQKNIRKRHAKWLDQGKWQFGSTKAMFKQKTMQVLGGDKEATAELYKRYAGGLVDEKRPQAFIYRDLPRMHSEAAVMTAIAQTEGQFVYSPERNEVGFMYEASMTVFTLVYQEK